MPPPPLPDALRAHLAVSYDLRSPVGEGGVGVVWLARDRVLERDVAIKVLRADEDGDGARRFLQEARLAARLQHPGVVPLLTFGEVDGRRFYVMPYVRGETLAARIQRGPMPEAQVRRLVGEVADALAYVHAQGIVHRDLTPANILLEEGTGRVVLAVFGIARGTDGATSLSATGMVVGTSLYLAPEQAMGGVEAVDGRADIYALGLVAWEALVGAPPFAGLTPQEVMGRKMSGGVPDVRERAPHVSAATAEAIARAVAVDRTARWRDARGLADAVRADGESLDDAPRLREFRALASNWLLATPLGAALGFSLFDVFFSDRSALVRLMAPPLTGTFLVLAAGLMRCVSLRAERGAQATVSQLVTLALRPPAWWPGWWPKRWRGPDLLARLPKELARSVRHWYGSTLLVAALMCAASLFMIQFVVIGFAPSEFVRVDGPLERLALFLTLALPACALLAAICVPLLLLARMRVARAIGKLGFSMKELERPLLRRYDPATARIPFVTRLIELSGKRSDVLPQPPADLKAMLDDVLALAAELRRSGWAVDDPSSVVDQARSADARWMRELATLAPDADPADGARLRARLDRLHAEPAGHSPSQAELASLLERQLRRHQQAQARQVELQACRDRLHDGCVLIWHRFRALRADRTRQLDPSEVTGHVRALAADVARLRDADALA